jgi:heme-degrading monooxygenase HmoA
MKESALAVFVRFKSHLSFDEVMEIAEDRINQFRALDGLRQKYYIHDEATDEVGGVYIWDSREAFDAYRESELRATIAAAYQAVGQPRVEVYRIVEVLRD